MISLNAGPLTLGFQDGILRRISLGTHEVLQQVYVAVRDRKWATVGTRITRLELREAHAAFHIAWAARNASPEIDFAWRARVTGRPDGTIAFAFDGRARRDFLRSRIGLCVLHPQSCAGRRCRYETSTSRGAGTFPELVSPFQPFKNLTSFSNEVEPGVWLRIDFEGDRFEMEDQRNWTDASFKTYSPPLDRPFPVAVRKGERLRQKLTISLRDADDRPLAANRLKLARRRRAGRSPEPVCVRIGGSSGRVRFALGFGVDGSGGEDCGALELAARLSPAHLRAEVHLDREDWQRSLKRGAHVAQALGVPLWCLVTSAARRLPEGLVTALAQCPSPPQALLVARSAPPWISEAETIESLRADCARVNYHPRIGGGTNAWFAQLNRMRPEPGAFDFVFFPASPQVHATDTLSIIENLPGLNASVSSARAIFGGKPIVVSPVTLRPRFIPGLWETAADDPRQREMLGAAWALLAVRHLSEAGAESATFCEMEGSQGLFARGDSADAPAEAHVLYPIYHAFRELSAWSAAELLDVESSDPRRIDGLALRSGTRSILILCNMTGTTQKASVEGVAPGLLDWEGLVPGQPAGAGLSGGLLALPPHSIVLARGG